MESVTYVNEIDVRKIAVGQPVQIALDADPSKKLTGTVTGVANVGEQRPNTDAKVFEVTITVQQPDTTLRPGMSTSNAVEALKVADALSIPLEAVVIEGNVPYVYKRSGARVVRQQVETGAMNDDEIVVLRGLAKDDRVLLSPPADRGKVETVALPESSAPAATPAEPTPAEPASPSPAR
jgi:hypothetical protein